MPPLVVLNGRFQTNLVRYAIVSFGVVGWRGDDQIHGLILQFIHLFTQMLAMVNDLLYRLMDYQREADQWHDEEDVEQKSVLKLKEIVVENACSF